MSDFKGIEITDVLGLSQPLTKLVETVSCGVGKLYEPTHIRRLAKAKAEEMKVISDTVADNLHLPISYQNGEIGIDVADANGLVQRAQNRFLFQEMKKQQNIEAVIATAYTELDNEEEISSKAVDEDWVSSFFDFVANVSNEQMQILWGKVLAGEVKEPDSFSIRTLDILRKLTQKDAICFAEIIPLVLKCPGDRAATFYDYFIPGSFFEKSHLMKKCGIDFPSIVRLDEARLVSSNAMISVGDVLEPKQSIVFEGAFSSFEVRNLGEKDVEMYHSAYVFTEAGKELLPVISVLQSKKAPEWYLREFAESLMKTSVEDCKNRDLEIAFF